MASDLQVPDAQVQLVLAYNQLTTRLRGLIRTAVERGTSTKFLIPQLHLVERALSRALSTEAPFRSALADQYARSASAAAQTLRAGNLTSVSTAFTGVDERALAAIQGRVADSLGQVREALTLGLALGDRRRAGQAIEQALRGDSQFAVARPDGSVGVRVPSGRLWDVGVYSRMLARTAMADSRRVAFRARYVQNGVDVVRVVPNGTIHDVCARWEGELLSLTGDTEGLPTIADAEEDGLFHPNCTHRYVVDVSSALKAPVPLEEQEAPEEEPVRPILGQEAPAALTREARAAEKERIRGPIQTQFSGPVSDEFRKRMTSELEAAPQQMREILNRGGETVHFADYVVTARPDFLQEHPRGWDAGSTFSQVGGVHDSVTRTSYVAERVIWAGKPETVYPTEQTGTLWHELGHAVDSALGRDSARPEFMALHEKFRRDAVRLKAEDSLKYFLQPGYAGPQEAYAEAVSMAMRTNLDMDGPARRLAFMPLIRYAAARIGRTMNPSQLKALEDAPGDLRAVKERQKATRERRKAEAKVRLAELLEKGQGSLSERGYKALIAELRKEARTGR